MRDRLVVVFLSVIFFSSGFLAFTPAFTLTETAKLEASDAAASDGFGATISISGNRAIVGAPHKDTAGVNTGSVFIFERDPTTGNWTQTAKLEISDMSDFDVFGSSVSISENRTVVGNSGVYEVATAGAAYVFDHDPMTGDWAQTAKLTAFDGEANDKFGKSVSISGNRIIVGASYDETEVGLRAGSAYIFDRDPTTWDWIQTAKLVASDAAEFDEFGSSVSLSGDRVLVGAPIDENAGGESAGSAYIFDHDPTTGDWTQTAKLTASDGSYNDKFGSSISISGDAVIVGMIPGGNFGDRLSSFAYIFERDSTTEDWTQTAKLRASDSEGNTLDTRSVSLSGSRAAVGNVGGVKGIISSVYIFDHDLTTGNWNQTLRLEASDAEASDQFGTSVSISGNRIIVGAYWDYTEAGSFAGSAYIFDIPPSIPIEGLIVEDIGDVANSIVVKEYISPLKQQESGTAPEQVVCRNEYVSIQRPDSSAVCLIPSSVSHFVEMGWNLLSSPVFFN